MVSNFATNLNDSLLKRVGIGLNQLYILALALILVVGGAVTAMTLIERQYRANLENTLQTVLGQVDSALLTWSREQRKITRYLAHAEQSLSSVQLLLQALPEQSELLALPAQRALRERFAQYLQSGQYRGFFIIGPGNINLASSRDTNVGRVNLLEEQPDILQKLWGGETAISRIQKTDVPLTAEQELFQQPGDETLFVGAPIKDASGEVIALLTVRLDPYSNLFPLLKQGRLSASGESYIFDREGIMLSPSRFTDDLVTAGLGAPDGYSPLNVEIRDPGTSLLTGDGPVTPDSNRPLTLMAKSATRGESGSNLDGYRDYRGVPVVGAWLWDHEMSFGITTEQDVAEAYGLFHFVRLLVYGGALATGVIILLLAYTFGRGRRKVREVENRLQAVVDTAVDAILVIDERGRIESANPAVEKLFGYPRDVLLGNNVNMLMPEPYQGEHDGYLARYRKTGEARIIGTGREAEGKRADGSKFPLDLSISCLELDSGLRFAGIIRDTSDRKQAERDLQEERDFTRAVLDSLSAHISVLDEKGEIVLTNKAWLDFAASNGLPREYAGLGANYLQVVENATGPDADEAPATTRLLRQLLSGERNNFSLEYPCHSPEEERWFQMRASRFMHHDRFVVVISHINITERKEAEVELIKAREEAETANRAKSTFLATMSHEIRTPLNGIVGTIDLLAHTSMAQNQQGLVRTAHDSSLTLMGIIDDILDFSKIEAGRLELNPEPLTLEGVIESIAETLQPNAARKAVELLIYCDPKLPAVMADPVRLRQIVYNLAGNAIKFSGDLQDRNGRVVLSARLLHHDDGLVDIRLEVRDNGIGMSQEVQQRLFRPFAQGEGTTTRRFGGTGLGLVICQRLVELMGGSIELQSEEGKGTQFSVNLSFTVAADAIEPIHSDLDGVKVLLLAGDTETAGYLRGYLDHAGAKVVTADSDELIDRFHALATAPGDLVVVIDGRGNDPEADRVLGRLCESAPGGVELKFLLISRGKRRYPRTYKQEGMTLDLNAMRRTALLNAVAATAGRESPELADQQIPTAPVAPQFTEKQARAAGRLVLVAEDNPTNRSVITQQLHMLSCAAEVAENGAQALERWRKGDYAMVLTDCHMPEMDGYELTRQIRQEEKEGNRIPIIAITADALKGAADQCFAAGMDGYLTKPMQLKHLREALEKWLPLSHEVTIDETPKEVDAANWDEAVDPGVLGDLLGIKEPAPLADYYNEFIESSSETFEQIRAAHKGGELEEIGKLAHKMKSAARSVGAASLEACCIALEAAGKAKDGEAIHQQMPHFQTAFDQVRDWVDNYRASARDQSWQS